MRSGSWLAPGARSDIQAAVRWYSTQSRVTAARFLRALDAAFGQLVAAPLRWPVCSPTHGARRALLRRFPYWVYYRDTSRGIEVIAVVHVRRRPDAWRSRVTAADDAGAEDR